MKNGESAAGMATHFIAVARRAMRDGDWNPAKIHFRRYKALIESATDENEKQMLARVLRLFGRILSSRPKTDAAVIASLPAGYIPPTPETAVKARKHPDPIEYMGLTDTQRAAAEEARRIYERLYCDLQAKGSNLNMDKVDSSLVVRVPGETMSDEMQSHFVRYFVPWQMRLGKKRAIYKSRIRTRDVVFAVLFDMVPLWMLDRVLKASNGTAARIVKAALNDYWHGPDSPKVGKRMVMALCVALGLVMPASAEILNGPFEAKVVRVLDGDTIVVRARIWLRQDVETSVRVRGVDTPESGPRAKCDAERAKAVDATRFTREAVPVGSSVWLEKVEPDKYGGRVLAQVILPNNQDLAEKLISKSHARVYNGAARSSWCE